MKKLYVGNLPYSVTESELSGLFDSFGNVAKATVITDRTTGYSKGFGFVEMPIDTEAEQAIKEMNGKSIDGREIHVSEAKPQEDRSNQQSRSYGNSRPFRSTRR